MDCIEYIEKLCISALIFCVNADTIEGNSKACLPTEPHAWRPIISATII